MADGEKKGSRYFLHECELPEEDNMICEYISNGACVKLRRRFRELMLISRNNNFTRSAISSMYLAQQERNRHLKYYYYMIHPYSTFRVQWELFMIFIYIIMLYVPFILVWIQFEHVYLFTYPILLFNILDIIVHFNMGYVRKGNVVMKRRTVARNYIRHWFFYDVAASIYFPQTYYFLNILRILTLFKYIDTARMIMKVNRLESHVLKVALGVILVLFFCTVLSVTLANKTQQFPDMSHGEIMFVCLRSYFYLLFTIGSSMILHHPIFLCLEIIVMLIGSIFRILLVIKMLHIVIKKTASPIHYMQIKQQLYEFIRYKKLPEALQQRIIKCFEFRFVGTFYKESELLNMLSPHLRKELLMHTHKNYIDSVPIFKGLPVQLLCNILKHVKSEVYLTGDMIIYSGTICDVMYYVFSGTVSVYTATGNEVGHLSEGTIFGQLELLIEREHRMGSGSVIAIDTCELYILQRKDFLKELEKFPDIMLALRLSFRERMRKSGASVGTDEFSDLASDQSFTWMLEKTDWVSSHQSQSVVGFESK